jgi:aminopeptidase N
MIKYYFIALLSSLSFAQQIEKVDFVNLNANLQLNSSEKLVSGTVLYQFNAKSVIDTIRIDAKNMSFLDVKINNTIVQYKNNTKELLLFEGYKTGKNTLSFSYKASPKQALYFIGDGDDLQIWTQGQGKYTSNWLPSFDNANEKVVFNLEIKYDSDFTVLSNGELKKTTTIDHIKSWQYSMKKPMSSYLVMLAIGKFANQKQITKSGVPLEFYLDKKDENKFEPTYRYSKQVFDYLEKEIGVKYPWKVYRQVPVRDFLYGGMENTSATIFAQDYVVDAIGFNDRNYVNVNAHELAHQWFGDLITAKSGKHHWLQEGFATYYALLAEKEVFGEDYFYHQLYKSAIQLKNAAKTDTIPVMSEKASSLSFYQKGAWCLHIIRESIGDKAFKKAVKTYVKKYQFKNVETDDFLNEIRKVSDFDVDSFKKEWLQNPSFDYQEAIQLLSKNNFIKDYLEIKKQKELNDGNFFSFSENYKKILNSNAYFPIKQEILAQIRKVNYKYNGEMLVSAINSNDYKVSQAVAELYPYVPNFLKYSYEKLMDDASYTTRELAFTNLWSSFPDEHENYLNKSKDWIGANDKSLRIQYLTLVQSSQIKDANTKDVLYKELQDYTSSQFESSIRQNAFDAILLLNPKDEIVLKNLINATTNFKWQFSKYAKDKVKQLLNSSEIRLIFDKIISELILPEQIQLKKLL